MNDKDRAELPADGAGAEALEHTERGGENRAITENDAVAYIHAHRFDNKTAGLARIGELLDRLGNPQNGLRCIHVAGTNGKGSVCAMTEAVLRACGYRTGLFVSPYMRNFEERIRFCNEPIPQKTLAELTARVAAVADVMSDCPNEFELITAIGFLYFKEQNCDFVVLETGLGGRLDPTNIIKDPLVSVITGVALDHTAILGDTVEAIAAEKAAIAKAGALLIWGGSDPRARGVMEARAGELGIPFLAVSDTPILNATFTLAGTAIDYGTRKNVQVPLLGTYQANNLATVLTIADALVKEGVSLPENTLRSGLSSVRWTGRFEKLREEPTLIFDGAHNPEGTAAALESIRTYFGEEKVLLISGMMADKEHAAMARKLAPCAAEVLTLAPPSPRALPAEELAAEFAALGVPATPFGSVEEALEEGIARAAACGRPLVVLGSLYLYDAVCNALDALPRS